jgi:hypothetical protein
MPTETRTLWSTHLTRLCLPLLSAGAEHRLRRDMPVEERPGAGRARYTQLEAIARALAGLAPFLELNADPAPKTLAPLAIETIHNAFEPGSPDLLDFALGGQMIVDAAFLSLAFLRAPKQLWAPLSADTKSRIITAFRSLRAHAPAFNNWLLFASTTEAFLQFAGENPDPMRVDFALRQHEQWYVGSGWYKDGVEFHHDYYNSYVIHPMLLATAERFAPTIPWIAAQLPEWHSRARRYALTLERFIAPDGTFPVTGRSITYRCAAFHHLADAALKSQIPETLPPAQVRVALTQVIDRTLSPKGTFDANGFPTIGLSGHQPNLGETYISTGSLYLATLAFLPLGLPETHPFWSAPDAPTTWMQAWSGANIPADHE